uniref:Uncharacterized protein n=1 Tax=Arundo donax TaxID=35708 RepID=A0A0A9FXU3_ARUDO
MQLRLLRHAAHPPPLHRIRHYLFCFALPRRRSSRRGS